MSYSESGFGSWPFYGNGDGRLIYPPRKWKDGQTRIEGPTPSIRWELIYKGIVDYEYFWMLRQAVKELEEQNIDPKLAKRGRKLLNIPKEIVSSRKMYTDDPLRLMAYREQVARTLEIILRKISSFRG